MRCDGPCDGEGRWVEGQREFVGSALSAANWQLTMGLSRGLRLRSTTGRSRSRAQFVSPAYRGGRGSVRVSARGAAAPGPMRPIARAAPGGVLPAKDLESLRGVGAGPIAVVGDLVHAGAISHLVGLARLFPAEFV